MNEAAVIMNILEMLEESYGEHFNRIQKVVVEAGVLCDLHPVLFQQAYDTLISQDERLGGFELEIKMLPFMAFCARCKQEYRLLRHGFRCGCGSTSRQLSKEQPLRIREVVLVDIQN